MIELNLNNIVFRANFAPINMGQTEKEVVKILGKPLNRYDNGVGSVLISYSGYEFHFFDDALHYFQNDNLKYDKVNHADCISFQNSQFKLNPGFVMPNNDISMKEVISLLKNERIDFSIENQKVAGQDYRVGEVKFLELSNGISLNFENTTTIFKPSNSQKKVESKELIFDNEMDFVLFAVRYEHWNQEK